MPSPRPSVSFSHAVCIFFGKDHTQNNVDECLQLLEQMPVDMELCHSGNESRPVLVSNAYINQHPTHYHLYPSCVPETKEIISRESTPEDVLLYGDQDIVAFINTVFRVASPDKSDAKSYVEQELSLEQICETVLNFTRRFENNDDPLSAMSSWMRINRPDFMKVVPQRKRIKNAAGDKAMRPRVRKLFVLGEQHWVFEAKAIMNQSREYKATLAKWKEEENRLIIGYARKSALVSTMALSRIDCLRKMVTVLKERSGADVVFVSPSSNSSDRIASRDVSTSVDLDQINECSGNTQRMLEYIRVNQKRPVVIVLITYAGFSTNPEDLKEFLRCHKNVKHLVVDNYASTRRFEILSREDILQSSHIAERFRCRLSTGQRSK